MARQILPAAPGARALIWYPDPAGGWCDDFDIIGWLAIYEDDDDDWQRPNMVPLFAESVARDCVIGIVQQSGCVIIAEEESFPDEGHFRARMKARDLRAKEKAQA